ncbi:MAG: flagellar biosynthetic protein FliO [Zoogloeaceae bacterium]|jgi:flagellar protein FliO/FliZ|nr:flagellar biosynthetic protein FliO [Zoogloeaceae bacterium]
MRVFPLALPFLLCSPLLHAAEVAKVEPGVSFAGYFQALLALAFIVGLLFVLAFAGRKFLGGKAFGQGRLKLLGGLALGPRERIVLVEAGDDLLVVGVVPGQIRTLHRMKKNVADKEAEENAADAPATSLPPLAQSFAQILQKFSRSRSNDK